MAQQWNGILVRADLGDQGMVPRNALASSPDIIVAGPTPLPDPGILTKPGRYDDIVDRGFQLGTPNYLYVRGKNGTSASLSGRWSLFHATPTILLWPYLWARNAIATPSGNRNPGFAIGAGAVGVDADPFLWVPPDVSEHYGLVAIAEGPGCGNPPQGVAEITSLAEALSCHANIAQRSVWTFRGLPPPDRRPRAIRPRRRGGRCRFVGPIRKHPPGQQLYHLRGHAAQREAARPLGLEHHRQQLSL